MHRLITTAPLRRQNIMSSLVLREFCIAYEIVYDNKKSELDILENTSRADLHVVSGEGAKNKLIHADNLSALSATRRLREENRSDLH